MNKFQDFDRLINEIKVLKAQSNIIGINSLNSINILTTEINELKNKIYANRLIQLKNKIAKGLSIFRLSTFELMEHNFRENTHSNVLQYLFDYSKFGDNSINILSELLKSINYKSNDILLNSLKNKNYNVFREVFTGKGRIDLLINDNKNKFNIVIENKLLSDISVKEYYDSKASKTQLDEYCEYINLKYSDYTNVFLFLSYYDLDSELINYEKITYDLIFKILKNISSNDIIYSEYLSLLSTIIHGIDKQQINQLLNKIENNQEINLNSIEILNKLIDYEN